MNDPNPYRRRRPGLVWWLWALTAAVAIVVFALLARQFTDGSGSADNGKQTSTSAIVGTTGATGDSPGGTQAGGRSSLRAGSRDLLQLARGGRSLAGAAGAGKVVGKGLRVQRRVGRTGFFAGLSQTDGVFVEVEQKGLTKVRLARGDSVSFTGTLERNIAAETYGLRGKADAAQLRAQRYHVKVRASQLTVE